MSTPRHDDPVIDEVREARRRISARFGHDAARLVAHYIELQDRHRERLVSRPPTPESRRIPDPAA